METTSKSARSRDIEAAVHEDHHHSYDTIQGAPNTNAYTHEDCHYEEGDETAEDEHKLDTDDILNYAIIEYHMRGGYP